METTLRDPKLMVPSAVEAAALKEVAPVASASNGDLPPVQQKATSAEFADHSVTANGIRLHYVTAGEGEPVLLIPGWPQSWYAWRLVMKDLAASGRKVYALDPRGFGDSDKPQGGYDLATASDDIHAFIEAVGLMKNGGIDIVSHDVGTWIAYAHASAYPDDVRRLVVSEALMPGTPPSPVIPSEAQNVKSWHFAFNRLADLPEMLVQGHERAYLTWLFANKSVRSWTIDPVAMDEYVRVFSAPGAARAGFEYYRQAFSEEGLSQAKKRMTTKLDMPILTISGSESLGSIMEKNFSSLGTKVSARIIQNCGHYVIEECGTEFAGAVSQFWHDETIK